MIIKVDTKQRYMIIKVGIEIGLTMVYHSAYLIHVQKDLVYYKHTEKIMLNANQHFPRPSQYFNTEGESISYYVPNIRLLDNYIKIISPFNRNMEEMKKLFPDKNQ